MLQKYFHKENEMEFYCARHVLEQLYLCFAHLHRWCLQLGCRQYAVTLPLEKERENAPTLLLQ